MNNCLCGCGAPVRRRFVHGHNAKGRKWSETSRRRFSKSRRGQGNPFYGRRHSAVTLLGMSESHKRNPYNPMFGKRHSLTARRKMSKAIRAFYVRNGGSPHKGRIMPKGERKKHALAVAKYMAKWPRPETSLETILYTLLDSWDLAFVRQKQIGKCVVDAFVPSLNAVFEADGSYWHQDKEKDAVRDSYLLARGVETIVHFSEEDLL